MQHTTDITETTEIGVARWARMSWQGWAVTLGMVLAGLFIAPGVLTRWERIEAAAEYRVPYQFCHDYWLFAQWSRRAAREHDVLALGDSALWGQYVVPGHTLPACLNARSGAPRVANLGLEGLHPIAAAGLLEHYGGAITRKKVLVYFNALWMTSPEHDLSASNACDVNHAGLVPQFVPPLACYRAPLSERLLHVLQRGVPAFAWVAHLKMTHFENEDIRGWMTEHPGENPFARLMAPIPPPENLAQGNPYRPWYRSGTPVQDFPWVIPEHSAQWRAFLRLVEQLQRRGNDVFVLVGPFNTHMLTPESRAHYRDVQAGVDRGLRARHIPHLVLPDLPSDEYGDASHPLGPGYRRMAATLAADRAFRAWMVARLTHE